jgi:alpha-glucosidase (family GH31 glycosyl hydrolase)
LPYIYSYVYETHKTGLPLVRAMVLEYQKDPATYSAYGQYLLGKEFLIAPLWSDSTFEREIYLPEGKWIDFWDDTVYQGKQTITYDAPIDKAPILIKAGAIIPMAPDAQQYMDQKLSPMTVRIYPSGRSSFQLYEDDGKSYDYEKGVYAITLFRCAQAPDGIKISKSAPKGKYKIPERDHIFRVHCDMPVKSISTSEGELACKKTKNIFNSSDKGWFWDTNNNIIWARVKGGADKAVSININKAE